MFAIKYLTKYSSVRRKIQIFKYSEKNQKKIRETEQHKTQEKRKFTYIRLEINNK